MAELSELPVSIVLGFDEPDGQISMLNKFLTNYRDQQVTKHCLKVTRHIFPWMKDSSSLSRSKRMELFRMKTQDTRNIEERKKIEKKEIGISIKELNIILEWPIKCMQHSILCT